MENNKKIFYEMDVTDENGIEFISLVDVPAIQSQFVALSQSEKKLQLQIQNKDKMILIGKVVIPDVPMLRRDENGEVHFILIKKEKVRKVLQNFAKKNFNNNVNVMHTEVKAPAFIFEYWIVEDVQKDKSALYFDDVIEGTLMCSIQVTDEEYWNDYIKSGKLKGFSLEGMFNFNRIKLSHADNEEEIKEEEEKELNELIDKINSLIEKIQK